MAMPLRIQGLYPTTHLRLTGDAPFQLLERRGTMLTVSFCVGQGASAIRFVLLHNAGLHAELLSNCDFDIL
jgi:hypothetical protein